MNLFDNLSIKYRMASGFGVFMLLGVLTMAASIWGIHSVTLSVKDIILEKKKTEMSWQARWNINQSMGDVSLMLLTKDQARQQMFNTNLENHRSQYASAVQFLKSTARTEQGRNLLGQIEAGIAVSERESGRVIDLLRGGNRDEALNHYMSVCLEAQNNLTGALDTYRQWRDVRTAGIESGAQRAGMLMLSILIAFGVIAGIVTTVLGFLITRSITRPIQQAANHLKEIGQGNFALTLDQKELERQDEFGVIARAIHTMSTNIGQMIKSLAADIKTLAGSSAQLSLIANKVSHGSRESSQKSETVAAAAEEMSTGMVSVAAGMEQATSSLATVAAGTEEMTATIGEIAGNSEKARAITSQAVTQADKVLSMINTLGQAAQEIGKVTETIMSISSQTNLLALNATIEAARAGASGKGFAVVAGEIKELAQQTAEATDDIKNKIMAIQNSTAGTIEDIEQISHVIKEVSDIVTSIASAIEEQSVVTRDIAQHITQATQGVTGVNDRVAQSTSVVREIAQDIAGVNNAAREISGASLQVENNAGELAGLADQLKHMVENFTV